MNEPEFPDKSLLAQTREWLKQYNLHARKRLGQHFLINPGILHNITRAAALTPEDIVLEIGPGLGVLTRELVKQAGWVLAVELDNSLCEILKKNLAAFRNISIINRDILEIEPAELIQKERIRFPAALAPVE